MLLEKLPDNVQFFEAVVVHCFTRSGKLPLFRKSSNCPRYPGLLGFPAGKKKTEDLGFLHAGRREFFEESGLYLPINQFEHSGLCFPTMHRTADGKTIFFHQHVLGVIYPIDDDKFFLVKLSDEHAEYVPVDPAELEARRGELIPDLAEVFIKYMNFRRWRLRLGIPPADESASHQMSFT